MRTSGTTATTTARQLRKVMKHSSDHRRVDQQQHLRQALRTTMLVAASMPALPAASRNWRSGVSLCAWRSLGAACDHPVQRLGLVVGQVGDHRHHRAVGVEQVRVVDAGLLRAVVQHVLVARDRQPLRVALVRLPAVIWRTALASDTVVCTPGTCCSVQARRSASTSVSYFRQPSSRRLDDHRELVAGQRVVGGDVGVVAVVARVGAQLGRAGVEVADLQVAGSPRSRPTASSGRDQRSRRCAQRRSVKRSSTAHSAVAAAAAGSSLLGAQAALRRPPG